MFIIAPSLRCALCSKEKKKNSKCKIVSLTLKARSEQAKKNEKKQRIRYKYESMHDMYVVQLARVL